MAFPIIENTITSHIGADLTSHTINIPSCAINDLILVFFTCDNASVLISIDTGSSSEGWNISAQSSSANNTSAVLYKFSTTEDDLVLTLDSAQQSTAIVYRISNAYPTPPTVRSAFGYSININPPSVSTEETADYLFIVYGGTDSNIIATVAPTNFTGLTTVTGSSDGSSSSAAYRYLTRLYGAPNYDPGSFTSVTAYWISFTVSIVPLSVLGIEINSFGIVET